jgi:hypothetical protein
MVQRRFGVRYDHLGIMSIKHFGLARLIGQNPPSLGRGHSHELSGGQLW